MYQPVVIVLIAAVLGIVVDRYWPISLAVWLWLAVIGLAAWILVARISRRTGLFPTGIGGLLLGNLLILLAVAAAAGAWHHCRWRLFLDDDLGRYATRSKQPVCVEAEAIDSPRSQPPRAPNPMQVKGETEGSFLAVTVSSIRDGAAWRPVSGRATMFIIGKPPDAAPGDRLRCFVTVLALDGARNPGGFDYAAYLRADRIRCRLQAESPRCISVIERGSCWSLSRVLNAVRSHGDRLLGSALNPRRAELAAAVLLGLREELDGSRNEAFLTTGTIHVLSISGLHIGVLAGVLFVVMRRLPVARWGAVVAVGVVTVLYAIMVDSGPPVIRATILVLIACVAVWLARRPLGFNSLAAAAMLVLAMNPAHLFHVGAQLSFLCVAGLIWFANRRPHRDEESPDVNAILRRLILQNLSWPSWLLYNFRSSVVGLAEAGLLLWILTLPLVLARFHVVSLAALGLNVLLWPLMSLSLVSGFCVLVLARVPLIGAICGWLCDRSLWLLEEGVNAGHQMPWGHFWLPGPGDWWLLGFYGSLSLALAFPRVRPRRRWCAAILAVWLSVGIAVSCWPRDRSRLDCTFLSVGHGCAVVVQFPSGRTLLYDAGQMGSPNSTVRTVSDFLWERGVYHIDAVAFSHPDIDHYNALPELLNRFSVGAVYVSPSMFAKENSTIRALARSIRQWHVAIHRVRDGDHLWSEGGESVEVLHPPRRAILSPGNADSLVLEILVQGRRIVLPGDLESPGLEELLARTPRPCDVLMAPHHGSRKSNSAGLAAWCKPRWVVFSGDGRWSLPDIDSTYRDIGGKSLHTYNCGAIRVQIGAEGTDVSPFVEQPDLR